MTMEEKNKLVIDYINKIRESFEENGYPVSDETVTNVTNRYINSSKSFEEIKKEIDELVEEKLEEIRKKLEFLAKMRKKAKQIDELKVDKKGITLNEQDIDLMMIANSKDANELQNALNEITNIKFEMPSGQMDEEQFKNMRQQVYNLYMKSLASRNEYIANPSIQLQKKIEYLRNSGILNPEELQIFNSALQSGDMNQVLRNLTNSLGEEKVHQMLQTMKDYSPIEKTGIIGTDLETYQKMFEEMNSNYKSITIDETAKYGGVALQDGTFDFRHLQKVLDFAKEQGKQVRLNALIFYMDCPEDLYKLQVNEENKEIVKQKLSSYVQQITSFINSNGYESTVGSIDVFNELLNRFAIEGSYQYRGDIIQDPNNDNTKSGWLKFLNLEDLCDIIAIARKNLPNTDFMYNDDNLIDPEKIPATTDIINRIKQYELTHGISLLNSIGTQMHIDNEVTKEQIVDMFNALSQYRLPIEITEFDMAMTKVDGLSEDEIKSLRTQKMNEVFEAINECKETDNIRGFTIWSKTDAQNFRVALENEQRIKNGQEPIKTLHGGFYNNNMGEKNMGEKKQKFQDFNYHTHTYRSGHSEYVSDEELLTAAKEAGISMLGFSEHVPNPDLELPDEDHRMMISEVEGYLASINKMKQENPDMTILAGFEAEYDPMKEAFLGEMREKVDYMILGQHFVKNGMQMVPKKGNPDYPIEYAKMVCMGMESGLFDIVAHPDAFLEERDEISAENKESYEKNCVVASHMICKKAAEMGIPLEINMGNALSNNVLSDGNLGIPHPSFWQIANGYDVKVLKGVDAHSLSAFKDLDQAQELVTDIELMLGDKMIKGPYNPVIARQNNPKLQEAYETHQKEALTYETHMIGQIVNSTLASVGNESDPERLAIAVGTSLNVVAQKGVEGATRKNEMIDREITETASSEKLTPKEKTVITQRKNLAKNETTQIVSRQQATIEKAKNNVVNAMGMGCESKEDYSGMITQMTQHQSTKNEAQKTKIEQNITSFQQSKGEQKANTKTVDKPKVLVRTSNNKNNNNSNNSTSKGFTDVMVLILIVLLVMGIAVGFGYMLYKSAIGG